MTTHRIPVPQVLQRPACTCGWAAAYPWPPSWDRWHADAEAHMATLVACDRHGVQVRNGNGRCPGCASDTSRAAWAARRAHYPTTQPQPEETR